MKLPTRKRGYQSEVEKERYAAELEAFCRTIIGIKSNRVDEQRANLAERIAELMAGDRD